MDPIYSDDADGDFIPDELDQDADGDGESAERDGPDVFENENRLKDATFLGLALVVSSLGTSILLTTQISRGCG